MHRSTTLALVALIAIGGCSGSEAADAPTTAAPTTASTATTSTTITSTTVPDEPERFDGCPERPEGSSPAVFDEASGTYAVQKLELTPEATEVEFDVVQWMSGEDAVTAYQADNPDDPEGPPNDYYIVNENSQMRNAIVEPATVPLVVSPEGDDAPDVKAISLDQLADHLRTDFESTTYWLTFEDGTVTAICEQYVP